MSAKHCHWCDELIDLDTDSEHFEICHEVDCGKDLDTKWELKRLVCDNCDSLWQPHKR